MGSPPDPRRLRDTSGADQSTQVNAPLVCAAPRWQLEAEEVPLAGAVDLALHGEHRLAWAATPGVKGRPGGLAPPARGLSVEPTGRLDDLAVGGNDVTRGVKQFRGIEANTVASGPAVGEGNRSLPHPGTCASRGQGRVELATRRG